MYFKEEHGNTIYCFLLHMYYVYNFFFIARKLVTYIKHKL